MDSLVPAPLSSNTSVTPGTNITTTTTSTTTMTTTKTNTTINTTNTTILHVIRFSPSYFEVCNKVV